jgi:UDP-N-acetylglucosamine--N-acetylmuramyl-(pentapeptide) pyrophosphoryl-undecaprenol N-acetylglucosamine transferase
MKLLLTCGGTAGHVYPAVALARVFQSREKDCEVLFVGADGGMELELLSKEGYCAKTVTISNFRRSLHPRNWGHNLGSLWNVVASRRQADDILCDFQPDLVVGTGGYASFPCVRQAARRKIPTAIHESNATPGLTTRTLSRQVDLVMVGFQEAVKHYEDPDKVRVTGTPVRPAFFSLTREQAREKLGIFDGRPLVLSFWGSLGAAVMNGQIADFITRWREGGRPFHHIHGAGREFDSLSQTLTQRGVEGADVRRYLYDMPTVMAAADLVLCRAGASTISELTALGKPAILVPSPNVTANHQHKNAMVLAERGGALLMEERNCSGERLYDTVCSLLDDLPRLEQMAGAQRSLSVPGAAEDICTALYGLLG